MKRFSSDVWLKMLLSAILLPALLSGAAARGAIPNVDESNDPIDLAMRRAVKYLYSAQKADNWEIAPRGQFKIPSFAGEQWGGLTALAVDTLLVAGENPNNKALQQGMSFLEQVDVKGTRALALKNWASMLAGAKTPAQKRVLKRDAALLMSAVQVTGQDKGLFATTIDGNNPNVDLMFSNDAVWGMWAAGQMNLEIPTAFWKLIDDAWRKRQMNAGGWSDGNAAGRATVSATAAGVATLIVTQSMLNNPRIECRGNVEDSAIKSGIKWLSDHSDEILKEPDLAYSLYTLGRVGHATGCKYFGKVDWYAQGVAHLLAAQQENGSWDGPQGPVAGTAWALLFLMTQHDPLMMNKLAYRIDVEGKRVVGNWNQRPNDVANIATWVGKELFDWDLNWHTVDLTMAADDLHEAPILFIAGNQPLNFNQADRDKLREFVQQGGMIVGHADCGASGFGRSFDALGRQLFPDYQFRVLPQSHLIFGELVQGANPATRPLLGLSNGVRELMILLENDPAKFWQIKNFSSAHTRPGAELMGNIYRYADKRPLRQRVNFQLVNRNEKVQAKQTVKVARLQYRGNWDPEPGGWVRLGNVMHNQRGIDLDVHAVSLGAGQLENEYAIAHLTGTTKFQLDQMQRDEIKKYVNAGGTLVIDSAGGGADFADAAKAELTAIFGEQAKQVDSRLANNHPLYSVGPKAITNVFYRYYAYQKMATRDTRPHLCGMEIGNRTAVIFSAEDMSVGLLDCNVDGIIGYDPVSASALMANTISLAARGR